MSAQLADLTVLEGLQVEIDADGRAFCLSDVRVPFDAVMHVEIKSEDRRGTVGTGKRDPPGTAWREIVVEVLLVTDDRMADPRLLSIGVRGYASDGMPPELDPAPLRARARAVAEAAARVCGRKVVG